MVSPAGASTHRTNRGTPHHAEHYCVLLTVALTGQTEGDRIRPPSGNISESVALTGQTEGHRINGRSRQ